MHIYFDRTGTGKFIVDLGKTCLSLKSGTMTEGVGAFAMIAAPENSARSVFNPLQSIHAEALVAASTVK